VQTIVSDGYTVSLQSSMQSLGTRVPVVVLRRVEELFPALRESKVHAVCREEYFIILFPGFIGPQKSKPFLGILCYFPFSIVLTL
jgi:hypothetical protein